LITDVKFDKLDYSSDNILSVTATISYDWAKLIPAVKTSDKTRKVGASNIPEIDTKEQVREIDKQSQQYGYAKRYILEREIGVPGAIGLEKNIAPPSVSTNETFSEGQRATNNLELQIQSMNQELEALKYEDQIQNAIANIGKNTETI
jgi:hypothetical protein